MEMPSTICLVEGCDTWWTDAVGYGVHRYVKKSELDAAVELLLMALPYVEDHLDSDHFKQGVVFRDVNKLRAFLDGRKA